MARVAEGSIDVSIAGDHTDLLIRISAPRSGHARFAVEATINGDSFFFGGRLNLDEEKLRAVILDNQAYGEALYAALFSEPIERAYQKAQGVAEAKTNGKLRLRLQIDPDASILQTLRWERLGLPVSEQTVPLSVSGQTPFSRFFSRESAISEPLTQRPVRMVVAISNPSNLPTGFAPIDVEQEIGSLLLSLGELRTSGKLRVTLLPGRSGVSKSLRRQLQQAGVAIDDGATTLDAVQDRLLNCHLFHFLGHGVFVFGEPFGTSVLYLEKPDGRVHFAKDDEIISRLGDGSRVPRLVFLAACESARRSATTTEAFVGLGPKLVQAGVPAVVGMQDLVPMQLARQLTAGFYRGLLDHGVIDQALNDARLLLFNSEYTEWSVPVLFMRIRDGRLFAPDPVRTLLERIIQDAEQFFAGMDPILPLDVIRVSGKQDRSFLLRLQAKRAPGDAFAIAVENTFANRNDGERRFAVLLGGPGMAKSTHLKHFAGELAKRTLAGQNAVVPVFSHLRNYFKQDCGFQDSFQSFLAWSIRQISPGLDDERFSDWLRDPQGPTFLFLIDGADRLDDSERATVFEQLDCFARKHPRHCYLLADDFSDFSGLQLAVSDYLVAQPMTPRRIKSYLHTLKDEAGQRLYRSLETDGLFDLAALPWLLVKMLAQVRRGIVPSSRTEVLRKLAAEMLAKVPNEKGLRTRAAETLRAVAWEMHRSGHTVSSVGNAFRIMGMARANREYLLEDLLSTLIELRILTAVGDDAFRFAYPGLQAWFTAQALRAMADREIVLDDITATLGRLSRVRWWEDTLVLLAGSLDDAVPLLRLVLYGGRITEGSRVFLAARCIQEVGSKKVPPELRSQVTKALIWLSESSNEANISRRERAIRTLGQLMAETAIPHLVGRVVEQVRTDWQGQPAFEFSSVRLAAVEALRAMVHQTSKYVHEHCPQFSQLLDDWVREDISGLETQLRSAPPTQQAIAAFVLGSIGSEHAAAILSAAFQHPGIDSSTRWAITDALLKVEPDLVTRHAILPFIDAGEAAAVKLPDESWKKRQHWYERVAYLIGNINPSDPRAAKFLQRCLFEYKGVWLKARTIRAVGKIADPLHKDLLEKLACGDFSDIALGKLTDNESTYLRSVAIDALAAIGDQQTLLLLQGQEDWSNPELQAAYYRASEEIAWRLFERSRAFVTSAETAAEPKG